MSKVKAIVKKLVRAHFERRKKNSLANDWRKTQASNTNGNVLSKEQRDVYASFWKPYYDKTTFKYTPVFHEFYYEKTGLFDKYIVPDDLYYAYIDQYFNDWDAAVYLDNKCLYKRLFSIDNVEIKQPFVLANRQNNVWTDTNGKILPYDDVLRLLTGQREVVIKRATDSCAGQGVYFCEGGDPARLEKIIQDIDSDLVVQSILRQHPGLDKINNTSINTIRIITLLFPDRVEVLSAILRMGINGSRVDNASSGGITCGIDRDGKLKRTAYSSAGEKYTIHPSSGVVFEGYPIPGFDKAVETVIRLHPLFPHFRLVSWDVAVDEEGEPVVIETNLKYGELDFHQLNNGPLFGDKTEQILQEVFDAKR